jgi:hypothetical protein
MLDRRIAPKSEPDETSALHQSIAVRIGLAAEQVARILELAESRTVR